MDTDFSDFKGKRKYDQVDNEIAEYVEKSKADQVDAKKAILRLEKAVTKNQELRVKYSEEPEKFMDSEAELDDALKKLLMIATTEHMEILVKMDTLQTLVLLLGHDNPDIASGVVDYVNECTDGDEIENEDEEVIQLFVETLIKLHFFQMLVDHIKRLNEKSSDDDRHAVFASLSAIENVLGILPTESDSLVAQTSILEWLLQRIQWKEFDANKLYAAEIIGILLQDSQANRIKLIEIDGVEVLLKGLNVFKKRDPVESDEIEVLENLFNALCSVLIEPESRLKFLDAQGIELMMIMLKENNLSSLRAVKVLNYCLGTDAGKNCCSSFVECNGLSCLFPFFMGKNSKIFKKHYPKQFKAMEIDESKELARLLSKFNENENEKTKHLVELHCRYYQKVMEQDLDTTDLDEEEIYMNQLESGLFILQMVDLIISYLIESKDTKVIDTISEELSKKGHDVSFVADVILNYFAHLGDESTAEQDRLMPIVNIMSQVGQGK